MTNDEKKLVEAARAMAITVEKSQNHYTPRRLIEAARTLSAALAPYYTPETIDIGGVRVNAGMREAPERGSLFYTPIFAQPRGYSEGRWSGTDAERTLLRNGMCCRTAQDAIAMHDAIVLLTGVAG